MMENYNRQAISDAKETALNFVDTMTEMYLESQEVSNDLYNDYSNGDSYHHENNVDIDWSLLEAAQILDQLSDYEETDPGLWHKLQPIEAVCCQAAYTYGNAVIYHFYKIVDKINEDEILPVIFNDTKEDDPDNEPNKKLIEARICQIIESF